MMHMYHKMLKLLHVDKVLSAEIIASLEKMRPPIVDPGGLLLKEMEKKLAKASADRKERLRLSALEKAPEAKDAKKAQQEATEPQAVKKQPKKKKGTSADKKEPPVAAEEDAPTVSAKTSAPVPEPNSVAELVVVAPPKYSCVGPVIISL
mmetsp:Transcript_52039/g.132168  ORF Transcript_52039/g.132168 Transcript_52039/m.132168 type:complete len:150 (+) Transcript_52039:3-452(+)